MVVRSYTRVYIPYHIIVKNNTMGNTAKNHATLEETVLQIMFNAHVQNAM